MNNTEFAGNYLGGICWDRLTQKRMENEKALENFGYKVYSQNDEDGIINEIFQRIGTTNKEFIEFGVQNGLESNCHFLLHKGWKGLWIEGNKAYCKEINFRFKPVIDGQSLKVINAFITKENINNLIEENAFSLSPDLLSIDIDGNDWHIWDSIICCKPRVVCVEFNGKFPPDVEWIQPYNPDHIWDKSDWQGASLRSMTMLGEQKGYKLVATNLNGVNAFFIKKELINGSFLGISSPEGLYNPFRTNLKFLTPGHPSEFCLAKQGKYIKIADYFESEKAYRKYQTIKKGRYRILRKIKNFISRVIHYSIKL